MKRFLPFHCHAFHKLYFYIEIPAKMVRLEFSFDCKDFAFNFRGGSKSCACKIRSLFRSHLQPKQIELMMPCRSAT